MKKSVLHKITIIVAAISVGAAAVATDALARDGGGGLRGGHFDRSGRAYLGGSVRGGRMGRIPIRRRVAPLQLVSISKITTAGIE
jgi:hypothetical protein